MKTRREYGTDLNEIVMVERYKSGLTQREVAEKIGSCNAIISGIEINSRKCSYAYFLRIMEALGKEVTITISSK